MARAKKDTKAKVGVLLTLRGAPANIEDVPSFLLAATGREQSAEALQEATVRYLTIGGGSPAAFAAERIAAALERKLNGLPEAEPSGEDLRAYAIQGGDSGRAEGPIGVPVAVGCHLSAPWIADAVTRLEADGCERIIHADLSPLESDGALATRLKVVHSVAQAQVVEAEPFFASPSLTGLSGVEAATSWGEVSACTRRTAIFAYIEDRQGKADDVPPRSREVVRALAVELSLPSADGVEPALRPGMEFGSDSDDITWSVVPVGDTATMGATAGARLVEAVEAAVKRGAEAVTVIPVGYTIDDESTLYVIDVLAADAALSKGVEFSRASVPNDSPLMIEALRAAVHAVL
jgi:protoheme ferro-lyase